MKYFAYGSNMNWEDLDKWCDKYGYSSIDPGTLTETGVIKGYKLAFNHYSSSRKGGALNIIKTSHNDQVYGALFNLSDADFEKIKRKEGAAYKCFPVNVFLQNGQVVGAKTFKVEDLREYYPPTEEYLRIVLDGAEHFGLREECLEQINKAAQEARKRANNV